MTELIARDQNGISGPAGGEDPGSNLVLEALTARIQMAECGGRERAAGFGEQCDSRALPVELGGQGNQGSGMAVTDHGDGPTLGCALGRGPD